MLLFLFDILRNRIARMLRKILLMVIVVVCMRLASIFIVTVMVCMRIVSIDSHICMFRCQLEKCLRRFKMCNFVGIGVYFLKDQGYRGWALRLKNLTSDTKSLSFCLFPVDQDIELFGSSLAPCMSDCCHSH